MTKSEFHLEKMDCPAEENLVRMKLQDIGGIERLQFDLADRNLMVWHTANADAIARSLDELNFDSSLVSSEEVETLPRAEDQPAERTLLWQVLLINAFLFVAEIATGLWSRSMGLVADSLDMLADAVVYGLSLYAVGASVNRKKRVAATSGYVQLALAIIGLAEVLRRFLGWKEMPDYRYMIGISLIALAGNAVCLFLLRRSRSQEAHMKASMIFTSNDVLVNIGVILAGVLVLVLDSRYPDLIIGAIVFFIVTRGALSILRLAK